MATILAHIKVREGSERRFEQLAAGLYRGTHENEKGVRRYEYWRGSEPRLYYGLLAFDDFRAFLVHQTSDHHEQASPALGEVIEDIKLEWVDPIKAASPLPETEHQEPAGDANELTRQYSKLFAARVADWWRGLR